MKMMTILLGFWLLSFPVLLSAQELTHITIENLVAGGLKDSLNADQQKKVQSLTLSGSMDKDDFSFIWNNLIALKELDIKNVDIDTIPPKTFWGGSLIQFSKIVLPKSLKYIENRALWVGSYRCTFVVTGPFPALADSAFASCATNLSSLDFRVIPSADNPYCKLIDGSIYSSDGKTIYYGVPPYEIAEGTEEIASHAFSMRIVDNVSIPASVKKIGDKAFAYLWQYPPTKGLRSFYNAPSLVCKCPTPPSLGKDVFYYRDSVHWDYYLYVPDASVESYKSLPEWSCFKNIRGISEFQPYSPGPVKADTVRMRVDNLVAGGLKDSLKVEDWNRVNELTLSGEMNKDDFYFINWYLKNLFQLDLTDVQIDTLTYCVTFDEKDKRRFFTVLLPRKKVYVEDYVLNDYRIQTVITGEFPELGRECLSHFWGVFISEGNEYCRFDASRNIYSTDGKDFFFYYDPYGSLASISEGVEVVHSGAFDDMLITCISFPSTLKKIEDYAFYNSWSRTGSEDDDYDLFFASRTPPILGKNAFSDTHRFCAFKVQVPEGCIDSYYASDAQWNIFGGIGDTAGDYKSSGISSEVMSSLRVVRVGSRYIFSSSREIVEVALYDLAGVLLDSMDCHDTEVSLPSLNKDGMKLVCVRYRDGSMERMKIIN